MIHMKPDLYYGIAAYNEEENILECLGSLNEQEIDAVPQTIICLNGCTDNTQDSVQEGMRRYPGLNIRAIHSKKGKAFAQNAIMDEVDNREVPIAMVDADVTLEEDCVGKLYEDMEDLDRLIIVGSWPVPRRPERMSAWENVLYNVLHARALHPQAEISKHDVSAYKDFVDLKPQPAVPAEFEKRSKIYFHGRTFMVRNTDCFYLPEDSDTADDTYLPNYIHTFHGPGRIRTRFDAICYYKPYLSLRDHFRAYRRIFWDLDNIDKKGEFSESRKMEETRFNWDYIMAQGPSVTLQFIAHATVLWGEEAIYNLLPKKSLSQVWQYQRK